MPNHVHLVLVPADTDGLRRALAMVHRRYAGHVHARMMRTGHFWQGRFGAVAMDGVGAGFYLSSADNVEDLRGVAPTYSANTPVFSLQYTKNPVSGVWLSSITFGPGLGADISKVPTKTIPRKPHWVQAAQRLRDRRGTV